MDEAQAREVLALYARSSRNGQLPPDHTHRGEGRNPSCGDRVELALEVRDGRILAGGFHAQGCALSSASAALMDELLPGLGVDEALTLVSALEEALQQPAGSPWPDSLESLEVLEPLRANRYRQRCVLLPWETLGRVLRGA